MTNNSILKQLLMALPIFQNLSDDELGVLAMVGRRREHRPEELLYGADRLSDKAILISAGRCIIRHQADDKADIVARRGMLINELSLFTTKLYDHSAVAMEQMTAYHFACEDFMSLMENYPQIGRKIQNNMALRMAVASQVFSA